MCSDTRFHWCCFSCKIKRLPNWLVFGRCGIPADTSHTVDDIWTRFFFSLSGRLLSSDLNWFQPVESPLIAQLGILIAFDGQITKAKKYTADFWASRTSHQTDGQTSKKFQLLSFRPSTLLKLKLGVFGRQFQVGIAGCLENLSCHFGASLGGRGGQSRRRLDDRCVLPLETTSDWSAGWETWISRASGCCLSLCVIGANQIGRFTCDLWAS